MLGKVSYSTFLPPFRSCMLKYCLPPFALARPTVNNDTSLILACKQQPICLIGRRCKVLELSRALGRKSVVPPSVVSGRLVTSR